MTTEATVWRTAPGDVYIELYNTFAAFEEFHWISSGCRKNMLNIALV